MIENTNGCSRAATIAATLAVALSLSVPMGGQRKQARIWGVISDSDGAPIVEAQITARTPDTDEEVGRATTDVDGAYSLLIGDATVSYVYRVEKDGYVPWEGQLKVPVKGNAEYNFSLPFAEGASGREEDGSFRMHPDAVEPFTRASEAARAGDYESAFAGFEQVLAIDDKVVPAYVALAAMHLKRGEYEQAAEEVATARELDPSDRQALELSYAVRRQQGASIDELMPLLAEMEEISPEKAAVAYVEVGVGHFQAGANDAAEDVLRKALALNPDLPEAHLQLGLCYVNQGASEEARVHLERVLELAPDSEYATTASEMLGYLE